MAVVEIRWHARGGQGAVTAAKLLAEMALQQDLYFQAFPEYGPERMGAPIQCFNRLSTDPINTYCSVDNPHVVVVVDPSLLGVVDFTAGLATDGSILVNTGESPEQLRQRLGLEDRKVYTVNASGISLETMGRAMPNTPMLGALVRILGLIPVETASSYLRHYFSEHFNSDLAARNVQAFERAYREVYGA